MQSSSKIVTTNKPTPSFLQASRPTSIITALKEKVLHSTFQAHLESSNIVFDIETVLVIFRPYLQSIK